MLFNIDIDFNEYDLYNFELEQKLNQKNDGFRIFIKNEN